MIIVYILIALVVLAALAGGILFAMYNSLVRLRNQMRDAWSQIDVQLKRRHDLIPNLVETVKGYMTHERETLEAVIQARQQARQAEGTGERASAEQGLTAALGRLFALAESYPNLKANQNFLNLQEEITSTENKISFARQFYNDCVMRYNNKVQMVPSNIVAALAGFGEEDYFELEDREEREVPDVDFSS
jgi:LemA protein